MMRLVRLFAPLVLALSVCTSSSLAWTADSFVGRPSGVNEVYSFESPVSNGPGLMVSPPSPAAGEPAREGQFDLTKGVVIPYYGLDADSKHRFTFGLVGTGRAVLPGVGGSHQTITSDFVGGSSDASLSFGADSSNPYNFIYGTDMGTLNYSSSAWDDYTWLNWVAPSFAVDFTHVFPDGPQTVQLDLSFGNFGRFMSIQSSFYGDHYCLGDIGRVEFLVNDSVFATASISPKTSGILYSISKTFTVPTGIRSVTVRFVFSTVSWAGSLPLDSSGSVNYRNFWYFDKGSYINWFSLSGAPVLDGWNDEAQGNINEHEKYESQWAGTMTDNFNKLDLSNFKFPVPLISGFALISGIFTDIWNAMGEYRVVYVFPLTLAIVLLLVGRISKFGGSQSSSKKKGDGDA